MNKKLKLVLLTSLVVVMILLGMVSCTSQTPSRGWAGVAAVDDTLLFTTMSGRIYSVDSVTNQVYGNAVKLEITSSGGGFSFIPSCSGPTTTPVAVYGTPATTDQMAFFGGFDGRIYAYPLIDAQLREQFRWKYPPDGDIGSSIVGGLVLADDKVYVASSEGRVLAVNAAEGYLVWSTELGDNVWSSPVVSDGTVYIGCFDKNLYALNADTGAIEWKFEVGGAMSAPPLIDNNVIYLGGYDRAFYAISTVTHELIWKYPAASVTASTPDNWFWAQPVLHNGIIYAPNLDGKVYAMTATTGELVRTYSFQSSTFPDPAISAAPVVAGDNIILGVTNLAKSNSKIFSIDATGGVRELTGLSEGINAPLFVFNGTVYIHTTLDKFYAINPQTGAITNILLSTSTSK